MHEEIFHILIKCSTLSPLYSIYPKTWIRTLPKSGPLTIIFVWVTKGTEESNFKQMLETLEACFGFCSSHVVQANHLWSMCQWAQLWHKRRRRTTSNVVQCNATCNVVHCNFGSSYSVTVITYCCQSGKDSSVSSASASRGCRIFRSNSSAYGQGGFWAAGLHIEIVQSPCREALWLWQWNFRLRFYQGRGALEGERACTLDGLLALLRST